MLPYFKMMTVSILVRNPEKIPSYKSLTIICPSFKGVYDFEKVQKRKAFMVVVFKVE